MKYTLKELQERNTAYADKITPAIVEHVNRLIDAVEQSRTDKPQPLDEVDYIGEYGDRAEHSTIDGESWEGNPYPLTICEHCTPEPVIKEGGRVTAYIGCGGSFYRYDAAKMRYIGKTPKTCKIYGGGHIEGYYPVYFDCTVSKFEYNAKS